MMLACTAVRAQNYTLPGSGSASTTTCSGTLRDAGGSNNYGVNNSGYRTIRPSSNNRRIELAFSGISLAGGDTLFIYDGVGNSRSNLIRFYTATNNSSGTFTSTDPSGALTVELKDNGGFFLLNRAGFSATIDCKCVGGSLAQSTYTLCSRDTLLINLNGAGTGASFQWQGATTPTGTYYNINGANDSILEITQLDSLRFFRAVTLCQGNNVGSDVAGPVEVQPSVLDTFSVSDSIICRPDSVNLLYAINNTDGDDFENGIDTSFWTTVNGAVVGNLCGAIGRNAAYFRSASGNREAIFSVQDPRLGDTLIFNMRYAYGASSFTGCEALDANEEVTLQYRTSPSGNYTDFNTYPISTYASPSFIRTLVPINGNLLGSNYLEFRFIQKNYSPGQNNAVFDFWALDDVTYLTPDRTPSGLTAQNSSYQWLPRDGIYAADDSAATKVFLDSTRDISLIIRDTAEGCIDTLTRRLRVRIARTGLEAPDTIVLGDTAFFRETSLTDPATPINYRWDFGDGVTANGDSVFRVYQNPGSYIVQLRLDAGNSCIEVVQDTVVVIGPPQLAFSTNDVCAYDSARFVNQTTRTEIVSNYRWDFGDGASANGLNASHLYANPGTYQVRLIVFSNLGYSDTLTQSIEIFPVPEARYTVPRICQGTEITFSDNSRISSGRIVEVGFDLDNDGVFEANGIAPGSARNRSFSASGNASVQIRALSNRGCADTLTRNYFVNPKPQADFSASLECLGDDISFTDQSSGNGATLDEIRYDFDADGVFESTGVNPATVTQFSYSNQLSRTVSHIAVTDSGCTDTLARTVLSKENPNPGFTTLSECAGDPVTFQDISTMATSTLTRIDYDFGNDGVFDATNINPGATVQRTFNDTGIITVRIQATANNGCVSDSVNQVFINPKPDPGFTASEACEGDATFFSDTSTISRGQITSVAFDFDNDGIFDQTGLAAGATVSFEFSTAGQKNVGLRATSDAGCITTIVEQFGINKTVTVDPNPDPDFTATARCATDSIPITDQSTISSGSIIRLEYDLDNDGVFERKNLPVGGSLKAKFAQGGSFPINVLAESNENCLAIISKDVTVNPVPEPDYRVINRCEGDTTQFIDRSRIAGGSLDRVDFDYEGDGTFDTLNVAPGDTVAHLYTVFGRKNTVLRATSDQGCVATQALPIDFTPQPVVSFSVDNTCLDETTVFDNASSVSQGEIVQYNWRFGDGGKSNLRDAFNIYPALGVYNVQLEAVTDNNCRDTANRQIRIDAVPDADFSLPTVCAGDSFSLNNRSTTAGNAGLSYRWAFGDGATTTQADPRHAYASAGLYQVTLIAGSPSGCQDSIRRSVNVNGKPEADFLVDPVCLGAPSRFVNGSAGASQYQWNFGDGSRTTGLSPQKRYASSDTFTVQLIAITPFGCRDTMTQEAVVHPLPQADFTAANSCLDDTVRFVNNSADAVRYQWSLGENTLSPLAAPRRKYQSSGDFTIQLIAFSDQECADTLSRNLEIYPEPTAAFSVQDVCDGDTVDFRNNSQTADRYEWSFGDANNTSSSQRAPSFRYSQSGTYNVQLIAATSNNCTDTLQSQVEVFENPDASFSVDPVCSGLPSDFMNTTQGATNYNWDFGDGTSSNLQAPDRTYSRSGTYTVELIAASAAGCLDTVRQTAQVYARPVPQFNASDVCDGNAVQFSNQSQGAVNYRWDFDDGQSSSAVSPSRQYNLPGRYEVELVAISNNNCADSITQAVEVYPNPQPAFSYQDVCDEEAMPFNDQSTIINGNYQRQWTFGNQLGSSSSANPFFTFPGDGSYDVELKLTSNQGCIDSITQRVQVFALPQTAFQVADICAEDTARFNNQSTGAASYRWDLGDGRNSQATQPRVVYDVPGTYSITLQSTTSEGCQTDSTRTLSVRRLPEARFTARPVCAYDSAQFINQSIGAGSYQWDFGDNQGTSSAVEPRYRYANPGQYTAQLIAETSFGCRDTARANQRIDTVPSAAFAAADVCLGQPVSFTNQSSANAQSYIWSFEPGARSGDVNPNYAYSRPNNYPVRLIVATDRACRDTVVESVQVFDLPDPAFSANPVCAYDTTVFINRSQNAVQYQWRFGDGVGTSNDMSPTYFYGNRGNYPVRLIAESNEGCVDSIDQSVQVLRTPVARFTAGDVCFGEPVVFQENASPDATTFRYAFDDGNSSTEPNPSYIYSTDGSYEVQLAVRNDDGCADTINQTVSVFPVPDAAFAAVPACDGEAVQFNNTTNPNGATVRVYQWRLGNGVTTTGQDIQYQYDNPGSYSVRMEAITDAGCRDVFTDVARVFPNPRADFSVSDRCLGAASVFANNSFISSGSILDYTWETADTTIVTTSPGALSYIYDTAGVYAVQLRVRSDQGCLDSLRRTTEVFSLPEAGFEADTVCYGNLTTFRYEGSTPDAQFFWSFGDDRGTSNLISPQYQYFNPGSYEARLEVVDRRGCRNQNTQRVRVDELPVADFSVDPVCDGEAVEPQDQSSGRRLSYRWLFTEDEATDEAAPSYRYDSAGVYDIRLRVSNPAGCIDSVQRQVTVYSLPSVSLTPDTTVSKGFGVTLQAQGGASYAWTPAASLSSPFSAQTEARPQEDTRYQVVVTTANNCSDVGVVEVAVREDFRLQTTNTFTPDGNGTNETFFIRNIEAYPQCRVRVFDRYGREVLNRQNYQNDWNGTVEGTPLPSGTYFYVVDCPDQGRDYKGTVTILRE